MIKNFFIPSQTNSYTPFLLRRSAITLYTIILLVFNVVSAGIPALQASASVDSQSLLTMHNEEREKDGLRPLTVNSKLVASAQKKAKAMLDSDCWDHYCPNGKSPWDFFDAEGYDYVYAGENLAEGFTDNQKVFSAWMASKTHRENIIRPEFTEIGIAIAYGKFQGIENNAVIVVHFGSNQLYDKLPNTSANDSAVTNSSFAILSPKQDAFINTNTPEISGQDSKKNNIEISENGKTIGETISKQGLFTYKVPVDKALFEGEHTIMAQDTKTSESDSVNFKVDTIAPTLTTPILDSVIKNTNETAILNVQSSLDTLSIESEFSIYIFTKADETNWVTYIPVKDLDKINTLTLIAYDYAANKTEATFPLGSIKGEADQALNNSNSSVANYSIIQQFGIRRIVNTVFILLIILLILIDYYALFKTNLPIGMVRSKAQYHLSIFIILLTISIAGGTAGELLQGTKL